MAKLQDKASVDRWLDSIDPTTTKARDGTHLRKIGQALDHVEQSDRELVRAIADARDAGDSWAAIAAVLGTSRQAAHRRFALRIREHKRADR